MTLINLDSVDSTNTYLKTLCQVKNCLDFTTVVAKIQTKGKGQRGSHWYSEPRKNLTFSILKHTDQMPLREQFHLSMAVSLGVLEALSLWVPQGLSIKWPNDIMLGDKKIGGILIENIVQGQLWKYAIIGIGINVNQTDFSLLPKATSLAMGNGKMIDKEQLLDQFRLSVEEQLTADKVKSFGLIKSSYVKKLYRFNLSSKFETTEGKLFEAVITDLTPDGQLVLSTSGKIKSYDLKTLKMIY
jgi:BirA family biotin operon repressor/biotin-[acetyl-CoA-carboxylase] ligase